MHAFYFYMSLFISLFFYIRQPHKFICFLRTSKEVRRGSDSNALPPGHEPTSYQLLYPALEVRLDYEKAQYKSSLFCVPDKTYSIT